MQSSDNAPVQLVDNSWKLPEAEHVGGLTLTMSGTHWGLENQVCQDTFVCPLMHNLVVHAHPADRSQLRQSPVLASQPVLHVTCIHAADCLHYMLLHSCAVLKPTITTC